MPTPTIKKATPKPDVQIYHFDPQTNEACGSDIADLDPLENKPLLPAFATLIAPPATIAVGKVAVFDEAAATWSQVEDHRGKVYDTATGDELQHDRLGVLPVTLTTTAPTANSSWDATAKAWVLDAVKLHSIKKQEIETAYQTALNAGVTYKNALFQSDEKSVQSLVKVLTALANSWVLPAGFVWVDAANVAHPATKTWLIGLNKAFSDHESSLFTRKIQAKAALAAIDLTSATATADIQAIKF